MPHRARRRLQTGLLIGFSVFASAPALAQADAPTEPAKPQADVENSYRAFKAQEAQRRGDPAFDFALGIAAADASHFGEAVIALQRVLAVQPDNALARAEIARVYALMGDIDTARAEFDTVVDDPSVPDPVRQRFTRLIRGFDRQIAGGEDELSGFFDVEGGWDSNINTATDETSIVLPAFSFLGPAALNGAATERGEPFLQVQGGVSASTAVDRQTRLFGSVLASWRDNLESKFVDQGSFVGSAGVAHTLGNRDVISVAAQAQEFLLDGKGYRTSLGGVARYTMRLEDNTALSFSGDFFRLDFKGNPLADANRFGGSVTYSGREIFAGVGAGREETVRKTFDHLSHLFVTAQVGGEFPVAEKVSVIGGVGVEYRNHDGQDPLFLESREDVRIDASLGVRVLLTEKLSVRPRVTYSRNESNLDLYDYDRWTASVGLRLEF